MNIMHVSKSNPGLKPNIWSAWSWASFPKTKQKFKSVFELVRTAKDREAQEKQVQKAIEESKAMDEAEASEKKNGGEEDPCD